MLKVFVLMRRREGMSREDFARHLGETHVPLVARMPGLRRLVVNTIGPDPAGGDPAWDAIAEDWFDDHEALQAALDSAEGQAIAADAPNFLDLTKVHVLVGDEREVPLPAS
jgi:uncharacterized protein (TIGR02118 family)